jgi:large subunit ribosomal protein L18
LSSKKLERTKEKRKRRVRAKIHGTAERPRLSVYRSARHIYAQAVDDVLGRTLASASTLSKDLKDAIGDMKKAEAARAVGKLVSQRLVGLGVQKAVFDRGVYLYHGRVKALAEGAREAGLEF